MNERWVHQDTGRWHRYQDELDPSNQVLDFGPPALLPGDRHFLFGGDDGALRLWSFEPLTEIMRIEAQQSTIRLVLTPCGRLAITSPGNGDTLAIWR